MNVVVIKGYCFIHSSILDPSLSLQIGKIWHFRCSALAILRSCYIHSRTRDPPLSLARIFSSVAIRGQTPILWTEDSNRPKTLIELQSRLDGGGRRWSFWDKTICLNSGQNNTTHLSTMDLLRQTAFLNIFLNNLEHSFVLLFSGQK